MNDNKSPNMDKIEEVERLIEHAIANRKKVLIIDPKGELEAVQISCVEYAQTEEWIDTMLFMVRPRDQSDLPWEIIVNGYMALHDYGRESETLVNIEKFTMSEFIQRGYVVHWLEQPQPNLDGEIAENFRRNRFPV